MPISFWFVMVYYKSEFIYYQEINLLKNAKRAKNHWFFKKSGFLENLQVTRWKKSSHLEK